MAGKLISMMQLIILQFVGWYLGWPSGIALAQLELSETITGSSSAIKSVQIACLINTAVFVTIVLRRRLYLEMGARDVMATIIGRTKLKQISDLQGLSTDDGWSNTEYRASVVMLSSDLSNASTRLFMKYMFNTHFVYSILLKYVTLKTALKAPSIDPVNFNDECISEKSSHDCNCVVFKTRGEITKKLVTQIPKTLKRLRTSSECQYQHCLLPCDKCRENRCHECNQDVWYLDGENLATCNARVESSAVTKALDNKFEPDNQEELICICIPLSSKPEEDKWTKALVKSFKSKDMEDRGTRVMVPNVLENYLSRNGKTEESEIYYNTTTFIVPRIVEILINVALTGWLKLDGFSSAMLARKAVRSHIVDSTGNGLAANAFLMAVKVNSVVSNSDATTVCQKLWFRGGTLLTLKNLSFIVCLVNLICSLGWAVSVALGRSAPKLYQIPSMPPSVHRLVVLMAAICICLAMDCFDLCSKAIRGSGSKKERKRRILVVLMIFEMMYIVTGTAVARTKGIKGFGRWVYGALQILVWVKWGVGCYLLGEYSPEYAQPFCETHSYKTGRWVDVGTMVYSSSFLLNAVLAGVRAPREL